MNSLIESLNVWGARFYDFAPPILWQSSLLIAVVFAVDLLLRRKIRAAVRYTLWFVVFIKLLIPPTLALPTSAAWWLRTRRVEIIAPQPRAMTISYGEPEATFVLPQAPAVRYLPPPPRLSRDAWILLSSICVSALLGAWSVFRWMQIAGCVRKTTAASGELHDMFAEIRSRAGVRKIVRLQLTGESMSPAVCGLFRPVVLLPQSLIERLDRNQLRAVLLHELIHLKRRDVWVNCAQTLLQIVYWWHPLLWVANARIRRVREEAVDDAVMFALSEEAEIYAPTLLEVAKLAFNRPIATLGLVGILESRNALRHRIERLLNFTAPRRVGVSVMSVLGIAAFTALAVPMGEPPARVIQSAEVADLETLTPNSAHVNPENSPQKSPEELRIASVAAKDLILLPGIAVPERLHDPVSTPDSFAPQVILGDGVPLTGQIPLPRSRVRQFAKNSIVSDSQTAMLGGTITENAQRTKDKVPFLGDLPGVGRLFRSPPNDAAKIYSLPFRLDKKTVRPLLIKFALEHNLGGTDLSFIMGKYLENAGVDITPPKSVTYFDNSGFLVVRGGKEDLQKAVNTLGFDHSEAPRLLKDGEALYQLDKFDEAQEKLNEFLFFRPDDAEALHYLDLARQGQKRMASVEATLPKTPINPSARTNIIRTSAARQKIYEKLKDITFFKISYPDIPLSKVIHDLAERTKAIDPEEEGINMLLNLAQFDSRDAESAKTNDVDLGSVKIKVNEELRGVRLLDVLDAIIKSADHPIKYSLLDYGIEFSFKGQDTPELHTRTFKLDPNTFYMGLQHVSAINLGNGASGSSGLSSGTAANHGLRYVTGPDTTTQIQLAVINFFNKIGVNLAAPKSVFFNDRQGTLTVHATDADLELIEQAINTLNIAPPQVTIKVRFLEVDAEFLDTLFMNGVSVSTNIGWTGILTESQFRPILKSLQKRDHTSLLNEGEITTLSGRQAQMQIMDVKTILNGLNATETNKAMTYSYGMTNMHFGTILDVTPTVSADGYTISMRVVPTVTEFLGYEDPKDYLKYDKNLKEIHLPLPKTRVRQVTTSAIVYDGQTLVLGNLGDESVVTGSNGAKLWQQPFTDKKKKKKLIVFITTTIIDPSGNRVHSKDYYDTPATY